MNYLLVFIGGGIGSVLRYIISLWWAKSNVVFPFGTLVANSFAAIVLAFLYFSAIEANHSSLWFLLAIGFCGGLSTFSTFSLETFQLMKSGEQLYAWLNILLSVALSLLMLYVISKFFFNGNQIA